jgi:Protein of unknown function (DUF3455)/PAP2 superfamily
MHLGETMKIANNRKAALAAGGLLAFTLGAQADVVTDWNTKAGELIVEAKLGTPPANRVMAIVQTAVHEAVNNASLRQPGDTALDAAVAAANRVTLSKLIPAQEASITHAYQAALAKLADGPAKAAGIAAGEQAAAAVLARRTDDGTATPERYRPHTTAGSYVPTSAVAASQWPARKPWLLASAAQFRPGPPPALTSVVWARDYDEVKTLGAKASKQRSAEQTEVARFWDYSLPPIYHGVVRSVANTPGRSVAQNARLFATVTQAMDDAMIAVFDAKYHYNFWRPVTAIRNGESDGNSATQAEAGWASFIESPLHPEYPSAHSILAATLGTILQAEVGNAKLPVLSTSSPTAQGTTRRWTRIDDFMTEVAYSRVWGGIHYRTSGEVGLAMGRQIGALAVAQQAAQIPPVLTPVSEARLVERISARGVQVYECRADKASATGAQWVFVAPQAELFDTQGASRGTHYAGPHWEAADGSKIVGKLEARADAPQAGAIPWLLLSARSVGGAGRFASVTSVQRVNTAGGVAPQRRCDASSVGTVDRVPYTADYLLYAS